MNSGKDRATPKTSMLKSASITNMEPKHVNLRKIMQDLPIVAFQRSMTLGIPSIKHGVVEFSLLEHAVNHWGWSNITARYTAKNYQRWS